MMRKGFGLKKWRRIKRDGPVKEEATPVDDGSKLLKRGLTGLVDPPFKHLDLSSIEAKQSSDGSVNKVHHHHHQGLVNGFSPDSGFMFSVGQAFEKSEEHRKIVSGSQGKTWSDIIKKGSEERVKTKEEKLCSSMDSDLRSGDFVFSSGVVSVAGKGEKDERLMMNLISKEGQVSEDGDASKGNNLCWGDKDPVADSIRSFAALQEALLKEVKSFQELVIPLHSNIDELSSANKPRNENHGENNSTSSGSQLLILKEKEKDLKHKLEEAKAVLEAKEKKIQELENSKTAESELEDIFLRKVESEIEHLVLTRSLNSSSLQEVIKQPKEIHSLTEDPEQNMSGETCKYGFYFLIQLILLVFILWCLILQFSPASRVVIPT